MTEGINTSASIIDNFFGVTGPVSGDIDVDAAMRAAGGGTGENSAGGGTGENKAGAGDGNDSGSGAGSGANSGANSDSGSADAHLQASIKSTLAIFGFDTVEQLSEAVKNGLDLKTKLGTEDVEKLLDDASKYRNAEAEKAKAEAQAMEERETPEETIARLKQEKTTMEATHSKEVENRSAVEKERQAIAEYNAEVGKVIDKQWEGVGAEDRAMLNMFLGVDNPATNVDMSDKITVRKIAMEGTEKFKGFLAKVKQTAIDDYAAGRGHLKPSDTGSGGGSGGGSSAGSRNPASATPTPTPTPILSGDTVDDAFSAANRMFTEVLAKEFASG